MRRLLPLLLALVGLAPAARAQTPFLYADGVEDTTAAKGVWMLSGTTGARFYTSTLAPGLYVVRLDAAGAARDTRTLVVTR